MAVVGDRVQVPSKRVGQTPRDGVVTGVSGSLLRVTWSGGEESTILPSMGSLVVVGKVRGPRAKKAVSTTKAPPRRPSKKPAKKTPYQEGPAKKAAKAPAKKACQEGQKSQGSQSGRGRRSHRRRVRDGPAKRRK